MQISQTIVHSPAQLAAGLAGLAGDVPDLLLVFGAVDYFRDTGLADAVRAVAPQAALLGCSTAGEISPAGVADGSCVITALRFADSRVRAASTVLDGMGDSGAAGQRIGEQLAGDGLRAILLFGPGVAINGSALVDGVAGVVGQEIPITGGLAGDGGAFRETFTVDAAGTANSRVVAVGLYGDSLFFTHGSYGGWEPFGPARKVTRCVGNVLYELDGEPALAVYKRYLGEHAAGLPASGLLFPFAMLGAQRDELGLIRTILGVDEASGSLTLAGEIHQDGYLKLMHASTDRLVGGAEQAAEAALSGLAGAVPTLALLVSCVGRKLVMGGRVDEEVEAVVEMLGRHAVPTGFYSYGEISPFAPAGACRLHNQTMTVTCFGERPGS